MRTSPEGFDVIQQGGVSLMVCSDTYYNGNICLRGVDGIIESNYYCSVPVDGFIPIVLRVMVEVRLKRQRDCVTTNRDVTRRGSRCGRSSEPTRQRG